MGYVPVSQRNSAGANIPANPAPVNGYTPVRARTTPNLTTPQESLSSSISGSVGGYLPVNKRPEGFTPVQTTTPEPVVTEQPKKKNLLQRYNDWAQNFGNRNASKPLTEVIAPIGVGAIKTVGSTLGALETIGKKIIPDNPVSRFIDRIISPKDDKKLGEKITDFGNKADRAISDFSDSKDKTYVRMVSEGLGSSIPFIAGGMALNASKISATLANAGLSGVESMINGYEDYKALLEKGDDEKTASKKALASFGANLLVNYASNKFGGFFDTLKPGVIPSLKRFLTITLSETGQETAQTLISNLTTGRKASEGLAETALITLPISGIFGLGGITIPNKKVKTEFENMVNNTRDEGTTDEELTKTISEVFKAPEEDVQKAIQAVPVRETVSKGAEVIDGYVPVKAREKVEPQATQKAEIPKKKPVDKPVKKEDNFNPLEYIGNSNKVKVSARPEENGTIHIDKFESTEPGKGNFKDTLQEILEYADEKNVRITLTPGDEFGSDSARLEKTFRDSGFIDNPKADKESGKLVYVPVSYKKGEFAVTDEGEVVEVTSPSRDGYVRVKGAGDKQDYIWYTRRLKKREAPKKSKRIGFMDYHPSYTPRMNAVIKEAQDNDELFPFSKFTKEEQAIFDKAFRGGIEEFTKEKEGERKKKKPTKAETHMKKVEDHNKKVEKEKPFISEEEEEADRKTPTGNAMAIYKDESTPEIPIKPGKLINDINPIEFPELVDLARELMGKVPQIVKKTGNAAGRFYADPNNPRIKLVAELFDGKNPRQMAVVLAHEIGHLVDFLPEGTMARGNLLGRLRTLQKFMKNTFGEGESVTNKEIREELLQVTQELHPYDPEKVPPSYKRYRQSAKELYAEAISMLFNNPGHLQEIAPKFWDEFFKSLDEKPEVSRSFFELQDLLGGDRDLVLEHRRQGVRGMFEKGDMMAGDIQRARMAIAEARRKDVVFNFKFNAIDKNYALIDRVNKLRKEGVAISDDENPIYYLEERNYLGGKIKSFMEKNVQPIYKKLQDNQISWTDFGEALFYDRIRAGDRSDVANPRGITPKASEELLEKMMTDLGEEKSKILVESMEKFRKAMQTVAEEAFDEGLYKKEMHDQMMKNPAYATFQVLDHLEEGMTSKIHKSLGTLKDISNPADASLLKTIATMRAIERNKVTKSVVEFLEKNFKEDIEPAKTIQTPKGAIPKESNLPFQEMITYMKDGKRIGFYVDKYIKHSVENETIGQTIAILRTLNSALFRPLFITYNPGFQAFNFARDFQRFWKNTPNMTIPKALRLYRQAIPAAKARAWGETTNEILQKMEEEQILSISYNQLTDGADVENKQIDTILKNSGIESFEPKVKYKALQPFVRVLDFIKNMGDFIETLPKVAGYLEFTEGGTKEITREQKSFIRKNIGSPDFLAGGFWKPVSNEVFLFSNAITQGIRSDVAMATDPKTRSGYWFKTAKINLLPKIMMLLASLGLFGKELKEIMDGASEYDKTNYTIVPLGIDENGKSIYFRMPQDEGGRLISSLMWKFLNIPANKQSIGKDFVDIASLTGGQIPGVTPAISNLVATGQFITGQNPYDWFRNREVLTDDQMKAGGKYALNPFLGWLFNQSGGGVFYRFNQGAPKEKSGAEKLFNLPFVGNILGRFVKVSDYGKTEDLNEIKAEVQKEQSRRRLDENEVINDYIKDSQKGLDDKSIEELVEKNKADIVQDVLGHAPETKEELARAKNIIKKYQIGLKRGQSDPLINSLISAITNEEKVELLTEMRKTLTVPEYNRLMMESLKYKIVSPEVFISIPNPAKK